jgi:hypothetical protein
MQGFSCALLKQQCNVLRAETVVAIADIVANQDLAMLGQYRFGILTPQAADHVADFFAVLRAMIGNHLRIINTDAGALDFFMEQSAEQGFGIEFKQFGSFDRAGQLGNALPAVLIVLVGFRHLLQERDRPPLSARR